MSSDLYEIATECCWYLVNRVVFGSEFFLSLVLFCSLSDSSKQQAQLREKILAAQRKLASK